MSSPLRVTLRTHAEEAIRRELEASRPLLERGIETGGFLLANPLTFPQSRVGIVLSVATDPGPGAERGPAALKLDTDYGYELGRVFGHYSNDEPLLVIGTWHTHFSDDRLSEVDVAQMMALRSIRRDESIISAPSVVSLIVTHSLYRGWDAPQLTAWLVSKPRIDGGPVVERAELQREGHDVHLERVPA